MRIGSLLTALAGIAVAGGSAYYARELLDQPVAAAEAENTVMAIVASRDIALGQVIDPQLLTTIRWPRDAVVPGTVSSAKVLLPAAGGQPRRAKRPIAAGELILMSKVSDFGEKVTIVQSLSPDGRAMAINVTAGSAVGGFVTPGDRVDIVLTRNKDNDMQAVTILQNIRIIGVDQTADENKDKPGIARTVTVEVTAEQGQKLALAQTAGQLSLTLRSLEAADQEPLVSARLEDLIVDRAPVAVAPDAEPAPEPVRAPVIRIRRANVLADIATN
ncbi:Flp pilus assembly protein CpaB [Frigidibacter sp. MR17.14]|uniref:Flp pilus assembly protein CpaB n=1 Tax=Frigidibacter sp. MR17.14 TaxID=3126509 RepID=UPI003012D093